MNHRTKLEKISTILGAAFSGLYILSERLDYFGIISIDRMIQGFILALMILCVGINLFRSNKLLGISCFVVSVFVIIQSLRFFNVFTLYNF